MKNYKKIEVQNININMEELLMVIQEQNKMLQDTIIYYNEQKNNETQSISRPIFNKKNGNKNLISLRMLSEYTNNGLKELSNPNLSNKAKESDEEEDIFINLQNIENRIEYLKMNQSKPRVFEQRKPNDRGSYTKEEIPTYKDHKVNILGY